MERELYGCPGKFVEYPSVVLPISMSAILSKPDFCNINSKLKPLKMESNIRPQDILQRLLDNFDKYGFVDIEDVCGHLLILALASVHTTTDTSTALLYHMAAFSRHIEALYEE
ncbi:hypothetical protein BGZ65_012926 [Modicella reniformis]|uniref:Uncharacterized protein n=1 Tax=Modicella reniformis TaxID=1440133 RepID=A0A9P6SNG6_9FUNG|nr:hypothetical protein BGZ65_012926 [Modicella reniformis]